MVSCADSLVWQLVSRNNAFLVKRNGRTSRSGATRFSKESHNLKNLSSFKYSGLANSKAVGIRASGKEISLTVKTPSKASKPSTSVAKTPLRKCYRRSVKVVTSQAVANNYRADLRSAALARYGTLNRAVKVRKGVRTGTAVRRGRGNKPVCQEVTAAAAADDDDDDAMPGLS